MIKNNELKKRFIKESLGNRNYFSYRIDLLLYKFILSIIVMLIFYFITSDFSLSIIVAVEVFLIFTLINKLNMNRKKNEGEKKLLNKMKKTHFKKKLDEINTDDFEILVGFLFEKKGCKNFIKKGKHMYLTEKDGLINCIKIYKLYDEIELEKIDVRNLITFMLENNIKISFLVTTGSLSEQAKKLIERFNDKLSIKVIDLDELFIMMQEYDILPGDDYFYNKIKNEKKSVKKKRLKNNVFDNKKIIVYIFAAVFFFLTSLIMPNSISRYISYYFILITIISFLYFIWIKFISVS